MSVIFLHTADWHLGKPFARVDDPLKRSLLQHERVAVIGRMKEVVAESGAAFVVVAGDLFDSPTASRAEVSAACAAIGSLGVPVVTIPGNHDHGGPGSVWEQAFFRQERDALAPQWRVLAEPSPLVMEEAVLLPCPLARRQVAEDPGAWVASAVRSSAGDWGARARVVLAHGGAHGFDSESDDESETTASNRLMLDSWPMEEIDYVALGDWHGMKQMAPNAWYAGAPEPDRFPRGESQAGRVLVVTATRGEPPQVRPVVTGRIGWHSLCVDLHGDEAVAGLEAQLDRVLGGRTQQDVVRLELAGSLGLEAMRRLDRLIETLEARLLRVRRHDRVAVAPTLDEVAALAMREADPLVARVASRLLASAADPSDPDAADVARSALRLLHLAINPTETR